MGYRDKIKASNLGSETRIKYVSESLKNLGVYKMQFMLSCFFSKLFPLYSQEQTVSHTGAAHSSSCLSKFAIASTQTLLFWTQLFCSGQTWIWYQTLHYFASSGVLSYPGFTPPPCEDTFTYQGSSDHATSALADPSNCLLPPRTSCLHSSASS